MLCDLEINWTIPDWIQYMRIWPVLLIPFSMYDMYYINFRVAAIVKQSVPTFLSVFIVISVDPSVYLLYVLFHGVCGVLGHI